MGFKCEECGNYKYLDREGSGEDKFGKFEDYICEECGCITRIYDNDEEDDFSSLYPNVESEDEIEEIYDNAFDRFTR